MKFINKRAKQIWTKAQSYEYKIARKPDGSIACLGDGEFVPAYWFPRPGYKDVIVNTNYSPENGLQLCVYVPVREAALTNPPADFEHYIITCAQHVVARELISLVPPRH